ncbi:endonuclease-8 [Motilibacter peucedani]|uniref:DNA-(apurinic or apyrimidinic site) lyase n=1 Tax=Motilibacter peucedani TaxID=598650 RepID=A0A420XNR1_9ACTN|nr:DNA-formamidopyrimidine glycosylase family protein [Motilibacter peucedani]RKS73816.1 endonuclease-8 [Motilibacter peucedani]
MPEGHTIHRAARHLRELLSGPPVHATSPQGRFATGAASIDGLELTSSEAVGKHLLLGFGEPRERLLHVHLGLYGKWQTGHGEPPEPKGALRLRLQTPEAWADLRGPTACEIYDPEQRRLLVARLGPDPLRRDADPERAWARISRTTTSIGALLMDQSTLAGVGNVYRAEVLFRARIDPLRPGKAVTRDEWLAMWADLVTLLRAGVRAGRIVTTLPEHRARRSGRARQEDAHYVYRRTGLPCRICGTPVLTAPLLARNLYWCAVCQAA